MSIHKKIWNFIWHDDSFASWIVNLLLAFVLVKWVIYPGLGLLFGTAYPIVAVVSGSMEHDRQNFETWWEHNNAWYTEQGITKNDFSTFPFHNGFQKGDIMILKGVKPKNIKTGDVLVYENSNHQNPIIHRVVGISQDDSITFTTKGDHNSIPDAQPVTEQHIARTGKAIMRLPYLGWIKIWFVNLLGAVSP